MSGLAILAYARSPVAPIGGALARFGPHDLAAPVLRAVLARADIPPEAVDAVVAGNALGAGGNPARMAALAAGLPDRVAAFSVDSQCCAGLDAVILAAGLLASGAAGIVLAGGVEAWSQAPIRTPRHDPEHPYDRPAFAPDPARDPDLNEAAAHLAEAHGISRAQQDAYAAESHARAVAHRAAIRAELVALAGLDHDAYARRLAPALLARMPILAGTVSRIAVAPRADGAAFVLLATARAPRLAGVAPHFAYRDGAQIGGAPECPMLAALAAARAVLARTGVAPGTLWAAELHEAFAVQAILFARECGIDPARLSRGGGGLGRGHPIGASGAVSLVRLLADMDRDAPQGATGLATVAAAGGLGSAVLVTKA